jgi:hypothetical protein
LRLGVALSIGMPNLHRQTIAAYGGWLSKNIHRPLHSHAGMAGDRPLRYEGI